MAGTSPGAAAAEDRQAPGASRIARREHSSDCRWRSSSMRRSMDRSSPFKTVKSVESLLNQMDHLFLHFLLRSITGLVFCLLLTHSSRGQSESVDSLQPIIARVGDDVVLPCEIKPSVDVSEATLEWKRSNLFVLVWRTGADLKRQQDLSYRGRTSLFPDELKHGNISLKLSDVKLSDKGTYRCYVVDMNREMFVNLVVVSVPVSSPIISLSGMDRDRGGVVLQCESRGWYPEPEVLWLDAEGNLLSAGPPETVRGPDDLYTVSSRVTVDKRHNNSFTCRVQQKDTHQTREAHIHVPDDFFSSAVPINTGLAVSLAVSIMVILAGVFFVWRQNRSKTKKRSRDEAEREEKLLTEEPEKIKVLEETKELEKNKAAASKSSWYPLLSSSNKQKEEEVNELKEEKKKLEEELEARNKEMETRNKEMEEIKDEVNELKEEKKKLEEELETRNKEMEEIKDELEKNKAAASMSSWSFRLFGSNKQKEEEKTKEEKKNDEQPTAPPNGRDGSGQGTLRDISVYIDPDVGFIRLKNESSKEKPLGGRQLIVQINNSEPITYTFDPSKKLKAGKMVYIGHPDCKKSDLVWSDLKSWMPGDSIEVSL